MGLSVPGARQARKHDRFLSLADTERQSGETLPRQGTERLEGLGEAIRHQHGQSATYDIASLELKAKENVLRKQCIDKSNI
jgi:hypothetical protein